MFTLSWQPPYDWSWMLGFLAARAVDGVETVGEGFYARSLVVGEHRGLISVSPHLPTHTVQVSVSAGLIPSRRRVWRRFRVCLILTASPRRLPPCWGHWARTDRGCVYRDRLIRLNKACGRYWGNW